MSIYFPHGGHQDEDVEGLYSEIDKTIDSARRQNRTCILLGDWNAVVGPRQEGDDEESVGRYGVGCRNDRGHWLTQWACTQRLTIANTTVMKSFEEQWTHSNGSSKRQIDFILICTDKASWIEDAGANETVGVGCDHRTTYLRLALPENSNPTNGRRQKKTSSLKGWKSTENNKYRQDLDAKSSFTRKSVNVVQQYEVVERILLDAGNKWKSKSKTQKDNTDEMKKQLRELIAKRRSARTHGDTEAVKHYGKLVQKEMKAVSKAIRTAKVHEILEEFKDIGQIKDLKRKGKKSCINTIIDKDGNEVSDVKTIAEVFADFYEALYKDTCENVYDCKIGDPIAAVKPVLPG